jgi:hypothetical protein
MLSEQSGNLELPATRIYEHILPAAVAKHSDVHYVRSSPYSGHGKESNDLHFGDAHQWNVWHGTQEPWHNWDRLAGRFVSEFGMCVAIAGYSALKMWFLTRCRDGLLSQARLPEHQDGRLLDR